MSLMSRLGAYCDKQIAQRCSKRIATQAPTVPIVSFTFDDFPRSALTVAGSMLLEVDLRGTFYASMGLMGQESGLGEMFDVGNLRALIEEGHELGCHTFGHLYCPAAEPSEVLHECEQNRSAAAEALGSYRLRNFSFPSGGVTWSAKARLSTIYDSCRTVEHGINHNPVDLGFLRANPLYSTRGVGEVDRLIAKNVERAGWLILYTHDVQSHPSAVGCTPAYFKTILRSAIASGASIMTIAQALSRYQAQGEAHATQVAGITKALT